MLEKYKYLFGVTAVVLLMLPSVPGLGPADQRGQALGGDRAAPVPARRDREDLPGHLPRGLSPRQEGVARARPDEGPRPAPCDLGRRHAGSRPDQRSRLGAAELRDLPGDAVHRHGPWALRRDRPRALRGRRRGALRQPEPRPPAGHRLARAVDRRARALHDQRKARVPPELRLVPARQEPLLDRERRLRRHRDRERDVRDASTARR